MKVLRLAILVLIALSSKAQPLAPERLQVENRDNPVGIDVTSPRLSWILNQAGVEQYAYQIRAATSSAMLDQNVPDLWDTGTVISPRSNGIPYQGLAMQSRTRVFWQVRVWIDATNVTPWSNSATWEMGLLNASDWTAQWIANPNWTYGQPLPIFARQFTITKPIAAARLYLTGLGAYLATLNGSPVTQDVLAPGNTRFDTRVEYAAYDIAPLLQQGPNAIGVQLGNGDYNAVVTPGHYMDFLNPSSIPLLLLAQIEIHYSDGTTDLIATNGSWKTTLGPTTVSTWYGGEEYDARREQTGWDTPQSDLSTWANAVVSAPPAGNPQLSWRPAPPVRVFDSVTPQAITQPQPGVYVFDMGINFVGWFQLRVSGPAGATVSLMIAEQLLSDGTVDQSQIDSPVKPVFPVVDRYTLAGSGTESWHPRFAYHGFRYLQVSGLPSAPDATTITGYILRGANEVAGSFDSSNSLLNGIHTIINRAIQSNMMSIFTDCPDREKLGWLADMQGIFDSIARNYDVAAYERTVIRNMADAQVDTGLVPDFVPEYVVYDDGFRDDPNWGDAMILTPWSLYETYGDTRTLAAYYPNMQAYLAYLTSKSTGSLLNYGLNDWVTPDMTLPTGVVATYGYYRSASALSRIAAVIGKTTDAMQYAALAQQIADSFNAAYLDNTRHTYAGGGHQAADAIALDMGIVPPDQQPAVLADLIADIRARNNHLNVGIVSLGAVFRSLEAAGRDDVIFDVATQTTNPSYGFQVVNGATTLTEQWNGIITGLGSMNHMMLGAIDEWFTSGLAGIRQTPGTVGYQSLDIRPAVVGDLTHVYGSYQTPYGLVESEWTRDPDGRVTFQFTIPGNTTATIELPGTSVVQRRHLEPGRHRITYRP
ncbi:MAG TPA: family 78 glycoside hydrolase catalytic domain [Bryobacteraceae bacterium]